MQYINIRHQHYSNIAIHLPSPDHWRIYDPQPGRRNPANTAPYAPGAGARQVSWR